MDFQSLSQPPAPYEWLTLDIETIDGSPEDAERFIRNEYRPESFGTWADITIGKRIKEAYARKKERLSLLTAAPIICVSLRSNVDLCVFHCLSNVTRPDIQGAFVFGFNELPQMLACLRSWWNEHVTPDTVIVGHNITAFDLPKLRWAYARHNVRLPDFLADKRPNIFDTMQVYTRSYSVGSSSMIALDGLLEEFGVDSHKGMVSGADVQQLYNEGQHDTIVQYALLDVIAESELYLRMTGRSMSLQ